METKRQLDVLDKRLADYPFVAGEQYTIADMAIFPWYGVLVKGKLYEAADFLAVNEYQHILRWTDRLLEREAVLKGRLVNRSWGLEDQQLAERHAKSDFEQLDLTFN